MSKLNNCKGQVLLVVVFIMVILLATGITSATLWESREKVFLNQQQKVQAYYHADSGIERVLARLKQDPEWAYDVPGYFIGFYDSGSVDVQVMRSGESELIVSSVGYEGNGKSTLEAVIRFSPSLEVVSWEEKYPVLPD